MIGDGDEDTGKDSSRPACDRCSHFLPVDTRQGANGNFRTTQTFHSRNAIPSSKPHRKRHASSANGYVVHDGPLDSESIYTAYVDALGNFPSQHVILIHWN